MLEAYFLKDFLEHTSPTPFLPTWNAVKRQHIFLLLFVLGVGLALAWIEVISLVCTERAESILNNHGFSLLIQPLALIVFAHWLLLLRISNPAACGTMKLDSVCPAFSSHRFRIESLGFVWIWYGDRENLGVEWVEKTLKGGTPGRQKKMVEPYKWFSQGTWNNKSQPFLREKSENLFAQGGGRAHRKKWPSTPCHRHSFGCFQGLSWTHNIHWPQDHRKSRKWNRDGPLPFGTD